MRRMGRIILMNPPHPSDPLGIRLYAAGDSTSGEPFNLFDRRRKDSATGCTTKRT
jgi:hypothetical protein